MGVLRQPISTLRRLSLAGNFDDTDASGGVADIVTFAQAMADYLKSDLAARLEEVRNLIYLFIGVRRKRPITR